MMKTFSIWGFGVKREKLQARCGLSALVREKLQGGQAPALKKRLDYLGPVTIGLPKVLTFLKTFARDSAVQLGKLRERQNCGG